MDSAPLLPRDYSKKTKSDLLKILNPSKKTSVSLKAQLILGVLDDCIQQMSLVSVIPTLLNCLEGLAPNLGEEVVRELMEHQRLGESYQAMMSDGVLDGSEQRKQQAKLAKAVQDSLQNILRLFRACPTTVEVLKGTGPQSKEEMGSQKLRDGLCELKDVVWERLLTTPSMERECSQMIREISLRDHSNQDLIDSLEREVAVAMKDRDTEISVLTENIQQLEGTLHKMKKGLKEFVVRTQQDAEKQSQSDKKTSEVKQARLQQEADQLTVQLHKLTAENREGEQALQKKKDKLEIEIENWIQKYDTEMGEKQADLEKLTNVYEEEMAELRELDEQYRVLELEYTQIIEEKQRAQEQKEQQERERELYTRAATVIQAHWRGFCVRKAMKAKAKPKKAKKGKGKKGK